MSLNLKLSAPILLLTLCCVCYSEFILSLSLFFSGYMVSHFDCTSIAIQLPLCDLWESELGCSCHCVKSFLSSQCQCSISPPLVMSRPNRILVTLTLIRSLLQSEGKYSSSPACGESVLLITKTFHLFNGSGDEGSLVIACAFPSLEP